MNRAFLILAILSFCYSTAVAQPETVGTVDVVGESFSQCETDFLPAMDVYFLEVNYDGAVAMTIHTRDTIEIEDTELALYDEFGNIIQENDDFDFPNSLKSELRFGQGQLPAGTYYLAVGSYNTVFSPNFLTSSNSTEEGNAIVKFETDTLPVLENIINIELNYNFNGIVHADEAANPIDDPDHPNGFRSISDRGMDFRDGVPSNETLDRYQFVEEGAVLDIVHLGNRNTVSGGIWTFDTEPDFDAVGIQPDWLADPDQTGRQTTMLDSPIDLDETSQITLLYNISNGGGSFDVVVGLCDGSEVVTRVSGPDWFGPFNGQPNVGIFPGAHGTDFAFLDPLEENTLLLTESIIDLGDHAGSTVAFVAFENQSSPNSSTAIYAVNIVGTPGECSGGSTFPADTVTLFRGGLISGTPEDTHESDDVRVIYRPGFTLNTSEAPIWVIFDAASPIGSPSTLNFDLESQAGTPNLTSTIEAFNWTTNSYDEVDVSEESFNTDTVISIDLSANVGDYVENGTDNVRVRAGWRKTGFTINFPWQVRIDQFVWTAGN